MENLVKQVLEEKGITQKKLAEMCDMQEVSISRAVNGSASKTTLQRIANALNMPIMDLLPPQIAHSKYEGNLLIAELTMEVAVLDDGRRVIKTVDIFRALGRPQRGNARIDGVPVFIDAQNLQPFISDDLKRVLNKIAYIDKLGTPQEGYEATILPMICDLYLEARRNGVIKQLNQLEAAQKAEILLRSLAKVGIIALVDEATGYDKAKQRTKDELQKILNKLLLSEASQWVKTFDDDFFEMLYRMHRWTWRHANKHPQVVGLWINDIVYARLAPCVLIKLKELNPKDANGNRKKKHHQFLTDDMGVPELKQHLEKIKVLATISNYDWSRFMTYLDKACPKQYQQLPIDFYDWD